MPATISPGPGPDAGLAARARARVEPAEAPSDGRVSGRPDDRRLIAFLIAGDERGLELAHVRYRDVVQRTALRILGDPQTAEEVTQDVFLSVWRARGRLNPEYHCIRPWLLKATRHRCIDRLRRRRSVTEELEAALDGVPAANDSVFEAVWVAGQRESVQRAVISLSPCQAQAVRLVHLHGYSGPEAALILGVRVSTVKGRLRLALASLAKALAPAAEQGELAA